MMMKSIEFKSTGDYDVLKVIEKEIPEVENGQLLVRVTGSSEFRRQYCQERTVTKK